MKSESAVDKYWENIMTMHQPEMPEEFKRDWVADLLETSENEFNDSDVSMSFQRMIITTIYDFYYSDY